MPVKNLPISMKFLSVLGLFGLFTIGVAFFAGTQIANIDSQYTKLIDGESSATLAIARANRNISQLRAAVLELQIAYTDEANKYALAMYDDALGKIKSRFDEAYKTTPSDAIAKLRDDTMAAVAKCDHSVEFAKATLKQEDLVKSQDIYRAECQPGLDAAGKNLQAFFDPMKAAMDKKGDELNAASANARTITLGSVLGGLVIVMVGSFFAIRSWIVSPINGLSRVMGVIAGGQYTAEVGGKDRKDEIGTMARAVEVFRDNGLKAQALEKEAAEARNMTESERARQAELDRKRNAEMSEATESLGSALKRVADGDLTVKIDNIFATEFEGLRQDFNSAVSQLQQTLQGVVQAAEVIDAGSRELSGSANDLSKRTEQQAAALEETAAALDEITANVGNSNKLAQDARSVAANANKAARESGQVVANAVEAMHRIEQSSSQISNIIGVIDEIAFQTNLLALNAGVEAARAGDAGKGFAVVAQEVRELAQRSAQAAKEIKDLIGKSSMEVDGGVKLVRATGDALKTIETYVSTVNDHMESIAASAQEQATGLAQVNSAVNQMDQTTQQNAAMVEESNAASGSLAQEADRLRSMMQRFRLGAARQGYGEGARAATSHAPANSPAQSQSPARRMMGKVAKAFGASPAAAANAEATSWEEF